MVSRNINNRNWFIQQFIVNEDDGLHDYLQGYNTAIRQRENSRIVFHHLSIQLPYRKFLVDYLKFFINKHCLSAHCLHLAIYLLDIFMDRHVLTPWHLYLVANTCLLLGAKFEEAKSRVPTFIQLNRESEHSYTKLDYVQTEISILKFFNWNLLVPTVVHFVQYYMTQVIQQVDLESTTRSLNTLKYQIKNNVSKFLYKIVDDVHYIHNFAPSRQAAAIIFLARCRIGLRGWSPQLRIFTGYSRNQLERPLDLLFKNRNVRYCNQCDPMGIYHNINQIHNTGVVTVVTQNF